MTNDLQLLNDAFNIYYSKAKEAQNAGRNDIAKRNFMLAAESLMKMAKLSKGELQKAQMDRARRLVEIAETLQFKKPPRQAIAEIQATDNTESDKVFTAAVIPSIKFSDIAGLDDIKRAVKISMIDSVLHPEKYAHYSKKTGGGLMLYGPPGTGKTMIAKAIANEVGAVFYAIKSSDIIDKYVGESEKNISVLFKQAVTQPRSIIFIDEMDALFGVRGKDTHNDKRVNEFLQQIDGFNGRNPNMLLLGATNRPWDIDSAAVRSGRFSQKIYIPLPDAPARLFLFNKFMKGVPLSENVDLNKISKFAEHYSGADIEELCEKAKEMPLEKYILTGIAPPITLDDFVRAFKEVKPTVSQNEIEVFERYAGLQKNTEQINDSNNDMDNPIQELLTPKKATPEDEILKRGEAEIDNEYKFEWNELPMVRFNDVAGLHDVKDSVRRKVLLPLKTPEAFKGYVKKNGGGLLLYGPPGTGKTMIAAAIANEINAKFCSVGPSDLLYQGSGNTEKAVRALFKQAAQFPCSVIFFDEMDSIAPKSTKSQYSKLMRSELLRQIQGMDSYMEDTGKILFLIAATNKPYEIDGAFLRPGRFGIKVYVGLPDEEAREYILKSSVDKVMKIGIVTCAEDIDYTAIIEKTNGFNGADMIHLIDEVQEISIDRGIETGEKIIKMTDFDDALKKIRPSVQIDDVQKINEWKKDNANND